MIEDCKNREVARRWADYSMHLLSESEQRQIADTGMLEPTELIYETEGKRGERRIDRRTAGMFEDILHAEYYGFNRAIDGTPISHFLDMDLGLISVINFGDTFLAYCKDDALTRKLLERLLSDGRDAEIVSEYIRVNIGKTIDIPEIVRRKNQGTTSNMNKYLLPL